MGSCFVAGAIVALVAEHFVVHVHFKNEKSSLFLLVREQINPSIKKQTKPFAKCWQKTACTQMSSCEEAYYFLEHCQKIKLDKNKNGVPCEMLCGKQR